MNQLDKQDLEELISLVIEAFWEEALDNPGKVTNRKMALKALEAKLIKMKGELS